MISSDDELDDAYPLFDDGGGCGTGWLASGVDDAGSCSAVANDPFDSAAFLCSSVSDDIANYNFLEPIMPISMTDDSGNSQSEQTTTTSSGPVDAIQNSSFRTSYTFDPVSLSIVRCVTVLSPNQASALQPSASTDTRSTAPAQNVAHNQPRQLCASYDDELDTLDITRRVSEELKRCNISQALFAQVVLGRSQGTLSDLLRKPKPWAQLKSGRETFAKMRQWLMEPEQQRLAYLNAYTVSDADTNFKHEDDSSAAANIRQ